MDSELERALRWWVQVLELELVELREWTQPQGEIVHLFCDASSTPAHLGAVVCVSGEWLWTHMAVPDSVLCAFRERQDTVRCMRAFLPIASVCTVVRL